MILNLLMHYILFKNKVDFVVSFVERQGREVRNADE